ENVPASSTRDESSATIRTTSSAPLDFGVRVANEALRAEPATRAGTSAMRIAAFVICMSGTPRTGSASCRPVPTANEYRGENVQTAVKYRDDWLAAAARAAGRR